MSDVDTHICGVCKTQFVAIEDFFLHKRNGCFSLFSALPASLLSEYLSSVVVVPSTDGVSQEVIASQHGSLQNQISADITSLPAIIQQFLELQQNSIQQAASDVPPFVKYDVSGFDEINNLNLSTQLGFENLPSDSGENGALISEIHVSESVSDCSLSACFINSTASITSVCQSSCSDNIFSVSDDAPSLNICDEQLPVVEILSESNVEILNSSSGSQMPQSYACSSTTNDQALSNETEVVVDSDSGELVKPAYRYQCSMQGCTFSSAYKKDLCRHYRIHTGEKPFMCSHCAKSFTRLDKLKLHVRCHTGAKPYKCHCCSYATSDCSSLKKHMRIHTNEKPFKCEMCSYASRNADQLVVHRRTHTGDTPFMCNLCQASFKTSSDLKRHARLHSGEKPFACDLCDYRCSMKGNLQMHSRINHSQDNTMTCEICAFQTPSKRVYHSHVRTHQAADGITHRCSSCNDAFSSASELRLHRKTHRKKTESTDSPSTRVVDSAAINPECRGGEKPELDRKQYACDRCAASFVCAESLRSHIRCHQRSEVVVQTSNAP